MISKEYVTSLMEICNYASSDEWTLHTDKILKEDVKFRDFTYVSTMSPQLVLELLDEIIYLKYKLGENENVTK